MHSSPILLLTLLLLSACASSPDPAPSPPTTPPAEPAAQETMDPTDKVLNTATAKPKEEDMFGGAVDTGDTFGAGIDKMAPEPKAAKTLADAQTETTPLKVSLGQPVVSGKVDRNAISLAVKKRQEAIQACFQKRIDAGEGDTGTLIVAFNVKANGGLEAVTRKKSTLNDETIDQCVLGVFEKIRIPNPRAKASVVYPVLLQR